MAKTVWRWIPCPDYDLEAMETWLEKQAEQGYFLQDTFAGFAWMAVDTPRTVRYRLNSVYPDSKTNVGRWDEPDEEQRGMGEAFGWYYVCRRGKFFIYACDDAEAPELHTDPAVQELQLKRIRREALWSLWNPLWFGIAYPLLLWQDKIFRMIVETPLILIGFLLETLVVLYFCIRQILYLRGLARRLRSGEPPRHDTQRRTGALTLSAQLLPVLLCLFIIGHILSAWSEDDAVSLRDYDKALPFATLAELAGGGEVDWDTNMDFSSEVSEHSTFTAPVIYDFQQHARIVRDGRTVLNGGLHVDYFEVKSVWLAQRLARELRHNFLFKTNIQAIDLPGVDEAWIEPSPYGELVLRRGGRVMKVIYYTVGYGQYMTLEEAAPIMADYFAASVF